MPYIKEERRECLDDYKAATATTCGELNYVVTSICLDYLFEKGESYQTYNDIIGALEGAKLELYRRKVSDYEDKKIKENGDVY